MPAIEIRPAIPTDIPVLAKMDHNYTSDHAWQMDLDVEQREIEVRFRVVQLPRSVRMEYPRPPKALVEDWKNRSGVLVALLDGKPVGYISLMQNISPLTSWVTDLVVAPNLRRQGIGSALLLAAQEWAAGQPDSRRLVMEIQPKNHAAVRLAQKLGFDFCGYNDHHFSNQDFALFFAKWVG
ncbi:MAG: GNAT family N-acetyltransferase [Anaerolineales bacterium]